MILKSRLRLGKRSFPLKVLSNFFKSWREFESRALKVLTKQNEFYYKEL